MAQNLTEQLAPAKPVETIPQPTEEQITQESQPAEPSRSAANPPHPQEKPEKEPTPKKEIPSSTSPPSQKSDNFITPSLGSIEDLLSQTREELKAIPAEKLELDINVITEVWKSYSDSLESLSTKSTLEMVKIQINSGKIQISVPSSVSKEEVIQEAELFQNLRNRFNDKMLEIVVIVDRNQFPELEGTQTKQIYTMKEKYEHLKDKNQKIDLFVKTLNLKIDQE